MRKWCVPLVLLLGGVAWLATPGAAAQDRMGTAGLTQGERVTVWLDRANSPVQCQVMNLTGEFLGCRVARASSAGVELPPREDWYNLRFVTKIERTVKD